ncbi:TPA: hypothetical protein DDW35_04030 [Candidatus Sumerlaeota bacterium]|jgi:hypothetical protein|nr:hypothetical protein [Candidatus Sumerlaeota bacterium]
MKKKMTMALWVVTALCLSVSAIWSDWALAEEAATPPSVVGRVYDVEGSLLTYIPDTKDWVAVVQDASYNKSDTLFTGKESKAELIAPNGAWVRLGDSTQIQFIAIQNDYTEIDMASGVARFQNKDDDGLLKVTTDFGYVLANPDTSFDLYVGDTSVEVIAIKGKVSFVHKGTTGRYDVEVAQPSILADAQQVGSGDGNVDEEWDHWNTARETFWTEKNAKRGQSSKYLPPALQYDSYTLEENGAWERVSYDGAERVFWRPTVVEADWSPFSVGRWVVWNGDQVWVPAERFGYMTHHYGNWVRIGSRWYWAPPVVRATVDVEVAPLLLDVGFSWTPGRVSWVHREGYVGWVPLAPRERFYSHHHWGGVYDTVVVADMPLVQVNLGGFAYVDSLVVVSVGDYWGNRDYSHHRHHEDRNRTTIINNYQSSTIVNNTVINNYNTNANRYNYTNTTVVNKPVTTVVNRIQNNYTVINQAPAAPVQVAAVRQSATAVAAHTPVAQAKVTAPVMTSKIVAADKVNAPVATAAMQTKALKTKPVKADPISLNTGTVKTGFSSTGKAGAAGVATPSAAGTPDAGKHVGKNDITKPLTTSPAGASAKVGATDSATGAASTATETPAATTGKAGRVKPPTLDQSGKVVKSDAAADTTKAAAGVKAGTTDATESTGAATGHLTSPRGSKSAATTTDQTTGDSSAKSSTSPKGNVDAAKALSGAKKTDATDSAAQSTATPTGRIASPRGKASTATDATTASDAIGTSAKSDTGTSAKSVAPGHTKSSTASDATAASDAAGTNAKSVAPGHVKAATDSTTGSDASAKLVAPGRVKSSTATDATPASETGSSKASSRRIKPATADESNDISSPKAVSTPKAASASDSSSKSSRSKSSASEATSSEASNPFASTGKTKSAPVSDPFASDSSKSSSKSDTSAKSSKSSGAADSDDNASSARSSSKKSSPVTATPVVSDATKGAGDVTKGAGDVTKGAGADTDAAAPTPTPKSKHK